MQASIHQINDYRIRLNSSTILEIVINAF